MSDGGLGDLTYKDDHRHETGPGHVTYHVEVEHGRRRSDSKIPESGPVTPAYLEHPVDKSYIQVAVEPHGKTMDEMDQEAHKNAYDMASATSPHDMVTNTRILHVEAAKPRLLFHRSDQVGQTLCKGCWKREPGEEKDGWGPIHSDHPTLAEDIAVCSDCGKTIMNRLPKSEAALTPDVKFTDLGREPVDHGTEKHLRKFHEETREDGSMKTLPIEHVHPGQDIVDRDDEHVRNPERDAEQPPVGKRLPNGHYQLMDGHHRFADALARGDSHFTVKTMTHGHGKCQADNSVPGSRCSFDWFMEDAQARMAKGTSKTAAYVGIGDPEHMTHRTFGPGGKYTTRPIDMWGKPCHEGEHPKYAKGIEAVHTSSGRRIGYLDWHEGDDSMDRHVQGSPDPTKAGIAKVHVSPNQRLKGMGRAMLEHARDLRPGLQHSGQQALTGDGAGWAAKTAHYDNPNWRPSARIFGPGQQGEDPRLFDGDVLKPQVRTDLLEALDKHWAPKYGHDWMTWAKVYFTGSEASHWYGNNDFDVLVGVHYDGFRQATHSTLADAVIDELMNTDFRADMNGKYVFEGEGFDQTFYVNHDSYDIRRLKPYAAYNVTDNTWAVRPVTVPDDWSDKSFPDSTWKMAEHYADEIDRIATLKPASVQQQYAERLFAHIHTDRQRAFSERGTGVFDVGNVAEKYLDQRPDHPLAMLVEMKNQGKEAKPEQHAGSRVTTKEDGYYVGHAINREAGRGKPRSDPRSAQGGQDQGRQEDGLGGSRGDEEATPAQVAWHPKTDSDMKRMSTPLKKKVFDRVEMLASEGRHASTHPLTGALPGWHSTNVDFLHRIVHRHEDGVLKIGYVGPHDYDKAQRRLAHMTDEEFDDAWAGEQGGMDGYKPQTTRQRVHDAFHEQRQVEDEHEESSWKGGRGEEEHARENGYRRTNYVDFSRMAKGWKPPTVSGIALRAADTGRLLMIQRSNNDKKDPARGTWEFPGGHHEDGDHTSLHAGIREWEEEVGQPFPKDGSVVHTWRTGPYQGHMVVIPEEKGLDLSQGRCQDNPDDPDCDDHEQAVWWDPEHAKKNPALRQEVKDNWSEIVPGLKHIEASLPDGYTYRHIVHQPKFGNNRYGDKVPPPSPEDIYNEGPGKAFGGAHIFEHQLLHKGVPVAKLRYSMHPDEPHVINIEGLAVHEHHQGKGLAVALGDHMQDHAEREGGKIDHGTYTDQGHYFATKYMASSNAKPHLHLPYPDKPTGTTGADFMPHMLDPDEVKAGRMGRGASWNDPESQGVNVGGWIHHAGRMLGWDWHEDHDDAILNKHQTGTYHPSNGRVLHGQQKVALRRQGALDGVPLEEHEQEARLAPGVFKEQSKPQAAPSDHIVAGARSYCQQNNMSDPHDIDYSHVKTSADNTRSIGRAFHSLPEHDPEAVPHFESMRGEIHKQFEHMTGHMGIKVHFVDKDPYSNSKEMMHDVHNNKTIKVLKTEHTGGHPFFTNEENDKFRAVHDVFGHAATGRGFDKHGEEAAYTAHSKMFSAHAQPAMETETRGQNHFYNLNGRFAKQKVAILGKATGTYNRAAQMGRSAVRRVRVYL